MRLPIAILLLATAQLAQAAEPIGRIFYTPEQREQLNTLRSQKTVAIQVRDEPVPELFAGYGQALALLAATRDVEPVLRQFEWQLLDTLGVAPELRVEAELRDKQSIVGRVDRNGQILLQTPQAATGQLQLKVGQSAELLSGRIDEPYAVQRTSPPQLKPETKPKPAPAATKELEARPPDAARPDVPPRPPAAQP